jgi:PAS domain S-box-containing protein
MPNAIPPRENTRRLIVSAALGLCAVIGLFAAGSASYVSASARVDHTLEVQAAADEWLVALLDAETGARGFILVSDQSAFLEPYAASLRTERATATRVANLVASDPDQAQAVRVAERHAQSALERLREYVALVRAGHRDEVIKKLSSGESKQYMDAFRGDVAKIRAQEESLLVERRSEARLRGLLALAGAALLGLASFAIGAVAWRIERTREALLGRLATDARRRLQTLSQVAVALSEARTRAQVAEIIVKHGVLACGEDTCTLYTLDDSGTALELIGDKGVAPEVLDRIRRIDEKTGSPETFAQLKAAKTIWAESDADYRRIFPDLAKVKAKGPRARAFWSVPLIVEGGPVGLLGMGFYEPRKFSTDERNFVDTLTKHCAQALLRAARFEREDEARRLLNTTLRSIGDAVIATDAEGKITFMNPISEALTGWDEAEARGQPLARVFQIFSEETGVEVESPVEKVLREGKVVGLANHTVLRSKSGVAIPIDDSGAPIRNDAGRLFGVVLVFRDVSHDKIHRVRRDFLAKAGEVLVSSVDYQQTLSAVAKVAVPTIADWCAIELVDPGARVPHQAAVAHVDPTKLKFARELGERYPPDPDAPRGAPQVIRTGKAELYAEIPDALLETSARDAEHLRLLRQLKLKSAMVVPLQVRGRTLGAMTFVHAESSRRYTESDLAFAEDFARRAALAIENAIAFKEVQAARMREHTLRDQAEIASRAKDEFLAMVSHELRTPLTPILGWTLALRGRSLASDVDRALAVIERNARAQAKLIEDVLDVSRIVSGKLVLALGPTNVADVIAAAIETVTPAAEAKNIDIAVDVASDSLTITADADRVQQIVWNLLSNAVKFTPKGGKVSLSAERQGSEIRIRVRDTGEGMRPEVLPLIFEPFRQADASTTRRHGGLGLGLAIVKQLVIAHGGTVKAESDGPDRGTTFTVRLPAKSLVPAVGKGLRSPSSMEAGGALKAGAPRLDGLRIVVIDDEEDALVLVGETLRERGAEVHCVASPADALDRVADVLPDVIVSDIGMPQMDGYSLIRKIRALPGERGGRTPAVALTAYARSEDAQRAFAAGFQMHVSKPVEPAELATVVANLGGRSLDEA